MTPAVVSEISGERNLEKHIERQMGCMAGFLQLFDRQQILARKRLYSANRLPNSPAVGPPLPLPEGCHSSPEKHLLQVGPSLALQVPVFDVKDGRKTPWKLWEAARLSLDSRAVVDARGKLRPAEIRSTPACFPGEQSDFSQNGEDHRRSPSVVARLMGLEALPSAGFEESEQTKTAELRRSASESSVFRDLSQQSPSLIPATELFRPREEVCSEIRAGYPKLEPPVCSRSRKGFIAQELFPDPKRTGSTYDEIEKLLRMRGINEPAKDLGTLKQVLEDLQLEEIMHTKPSELQAAGDSFIAGIKPAAKLPPLRTPGSEPPPLHHRSTFPRRPMPPESIPPARAESSKSPISSPMRTRSANVEGERDSKPQRRILTVQYPQPSPRRPVSEKLGPRPQIPRRPKAEISFNVIPYSPAEGDASYSSDNCIIRSPSKLDFHRAGMEERKTGRFLLERCGKLLHSIEAITNSSAEMETAADQQPSPVSVLDSSFLSEESSAKRSIVFKEHLAEWEYKVRPTTEDFSGARALSGNERSLARWLRVRSEGAIDLASKEWEVPGREMSDAVLYIERLIFKDLMANTIQELSVLSGRRGPTALPRRKLIF